VVIAYLATVILFFPRFFDVLPTLLQAYVPVKEPLLLLLQKPWLLANLTMLAALLTCVRRGDTRTIAFATASIGFVGAYFLQGKGWVNHGYPGVALAFLALTMGVAPALVTFASGRFDAPWLKARRAVLFVMLPAIAGLPILFGTLIQFGMREEYEGLTDAVRRLGPAHPKLIAVSADLDLGHPLVRRVDGVWIGQPHSLWLMLSAQLLIDAGRGDAKTLAEFVTNDARMFAHNVRNKTPDLILVSQGQRIDQMLANPDIEMAMAAYAPAETIGEITIWTPKRSSNIAR
jgi:hypothetical protein